MENNNEHPWSVEASGGWKTYGYRKNQWSWHPDYGFDLTRSPTTRRIGLKTTNAAITIAPEHTALIIIDTQNFFLSRSLGRTGAGHAAEEALLKFGIPAARKAHIQIIWLTWGVTQADFDVMDPTTARIFSFNGTEKRRIKLFTMLDPKSPPANREVEIDVEIPCEGIGSDIGDIKLLSGHTVPGGRLLMQGEWNTALHGPLEAAFQQGLKLNQRPDVRFHKNRLSGMCDTMTACTDFLRNNGIHTLLFSGVNTDQCVLATIQDANLKGFDTILLQDGCAQSSTEYNCGKSWGFMTTCQELADAVGC